jgi:dATP pyrophosphohydrolase
MQIKNLMIEAHLFRKIENDIEFLLLKRNKKESYPGLWQMVTGIINDNETAVTAAIREIKEETKLIPQKVWVVPNVNSFYSPDDDSIYNIPVFAGLIEANENPILSDEHSDFMWASFERAVELLAWEGQRKSVRLIKHYFLHDIDFFSFTEISM